MQEVYRDGSGSDIKSLDEAYPDTSAALIKSLEKEEVDHVKVFLVGSEAHRKARRKVRKMIAKKRKQK